MIQVSGRTSSGIGHTAYACDTTIVVDISPPLASADLKFLATLLKQVLIKDVWIFPGTNKFSYAYGVRY